jgi:hypothetical protein
MNDHIKIKAFIAGIKEYDKHGDITTLFTTGYCYGFALMLKQAFKQGKLFWDKYNGHAIFNLGNHYYDIRGEYFPQNYTMLTEITVEIVETEFRY